MVNNNNNNIDDGIKISFKLFGWTLFNNFKKPTETPKVENRVATTKDTPTGFFFKWSLFDIIKLKISRKGQDE
ncbi:hypothetical protein DICPUDRAFT_155916 [Dictyostelium purpureum]|uniref:Uncharacterized protein n=1 Tax=Dictyostelium purpureum TaxID=5786 RepID=F0ZV78_DICPU|nr:uncharacterized protein DICPUDRAFT_155916 [Dictyostelium purpureum]EGC32146.1 hypothetical protein DICPUDRAFT_155916 [Dictyostelium purpureum]|eukprot:XP_003291318.1 hypothetical protein DICPUDRAFT_155916 [Dictyostelium purpureum]